MRRFSGNVAKPGLFCSYSFISLSTVKFLFKAICIYRLEYIFVREGGGEGVESGQSATDENYP